MKLPTKLPRHRSETHDLTKPIEAALNRLTGVRVARNNTGVLVDKRGIPVRFGLGTGSADLVGIVTISFGFDLVGRDGLPVKLGRVFCLECKLPGKEPTPDQIRWLDTVRRLGGFACVVHTIEEAMSAVDRCRAGDSR